ncbi:MAG TPA: helix-turn-helix transcriptional regulator [Stellaceae bacterium]|jgi:transcriptional regulator with XRE-family HTH domain|nr:helix-turn-helix transcriptional regulator [Stellaceae bacterium]
MAQTPPRRPRRRPGDGPDPIDLGVGARIRERRDSLGITQDRLAAAIGVTFQQVQKYERAANRIGASRLWYIARALDVPVPFFFGEDDPARALGFGEDRADGFDADPLRRRETKELVNSYFEIVDPELRRGFFELARSLASDPPKRRPRTRK